MNWTILIIILILTVIAAIIEYIRTQDYRAAIVFIVGVFISISVSMLFNEGPSESDIMEYQTYYEGKREQIDNAVRNREYDLALDNLLQLADETESVYGENSLELGNLYAEIGMLYNFLSDSVNAQKYAGFSNSIVLQHVPNEENYTQIVEIYKACGDVENEITKREFYYNRALQILEEFRDTSGQLAAVIYANFSDAYVRVNDYVSALDYAERAKSLFEGKKGATTREAGIAYCSLGNIYAMRNHVEAIGYYKQAEKIFKNNSPDDDCFLAVCYSGMANIYSKIDQKLCYEYAFEAWNINKLIFGELHEHTIRSEKDMAVFYRINGDVEHAKMIIEDALVKAQEKYSESPLMATIYIELANLADSKQECLDSYNKAELILRKIYGDNHLEVAYVYSNISVTYYLNNDLINAKQYYNKAVQIYEDKSGSFDPELAELYIYRGEMYCDEEDYISAIKKYEDAKKIFDTLYGNTNINSARCKYKIANAYSHEGEKGISDGLFEQSIDIYEMVYGEDSFQNADLYFQYARHICRYGGDINEAIRYAKKAVESSLKYGLGNSFEQKEYCFLLGNLYIESGNTETGIDYLKECVRISEYNDIIDPTYIQALCALAQHYSIIEGGRELAIQYINITTSAAAKVGGYDDLCAAYYHTSIAWGNLGEYEEALGFLDIAEENGLKIYSENSKFISMIKEYRDHINGCK